MAWALAGWGDKDEHAGQPLKHLLVFLTVQRQVTSGCREGGQLIVIGSKRSTRKWELAKRKEELNLEHKVSTSLMVHILDYQTKIELQTTSYNNLQFRTSDHKLQPKVCSPFVIAA